jgi:hypothetical protein
MPRIMEMRSERPIRTLPSRRARPIFASSDPDRIIGSPRVASTPLSQHGTPNHARRISDMNRARSLRARMSFDQRPQRQVNFSRRNLNFDPAGSSSESENEVMPDLEDQDNDSDHDADTEDTSSEDEENSHEFFEAQDSDADDQEPMDEDQHMEDWQPDQESNSSASSIAAPEGTPERHEQQLRKKRRYHQKEYNTFWDMYLEIQRKQDEIDDQDHKSKRKLFKVTVRTKKGMETHFDEGEEICKQLSLPITTRSRLQHEEATAELEEWIQEAEGLMGNSSVTSQLMNSSLSIPISQDRGTVILGTVRGDVEMEDMPMPPGWFDPPVDDKSELEEFRRNKDKIELFVFDGSNETASWETWWEYFKEAVHKYPENVCHTFRKLKYLHKYVQGVPRVESGLDNPELFQHKSNYAACMQSLHQVYGKQTVNFSDMSQLVANYSPEGKERKHFLAFISNLYMYAQRFVAIGASPENAYQLALGRILSCLPQERRRYMLDKFAGKHNDNTPSSKKFMDYRYFLNTYYGDMKQKILPYNSKEAGADQKNSQKGESEKKNNKRKADSGKQEDSGKKKKLEGKKPWSPMKKSIFMACKLHPNAKSEHAVVECRLSQELKEKLCKKLNICSVCQRSGHEAKDCYQKQVVSLLTTQHPGKQEKFDKKKKGKKGSGKGPYPQREDSDKKSDDASTKDSGNKEVSSGSKPSSA